jgi:hypothetical protein
MDRMMLRNAHLDPLVAEPVSHRPDSLLDSEPSRQVRRKYVRTQESKCIHVAGSCHRSSVVDSLTDDAVIQAERFDLLD